ncbi:MAG: acylphosphatase [Aigarchaeota archaeon]|nr:acylphosphatase [Candidatus Pelearchaeum maunauluense]
MGEEVTKAYAVKVVGRVQRVGYRRLILEAAQELGLAGYVKNERDGSVTVFVQGSEENIARFLKLIKSPPPPAVVKTFTEKLTKPKPQLKAFTIKFGTIQEELQEGFGAMQSIFMDYWGEFRDYRQEFRDFRQEFRGFLSDFSDYRQEFRDFRQEFRDYRQEFRDFRQEFRGFLSDFSDYRQEFRDFRQEFKDFREELRDYRQEFKSFASEFRDYREEFREFAKRTNENFKLILEKYGEISDKLTVILDTLVKESKETRDRLAEAIQLLRQAIDKITKE